VEVSRRNDGERCCRKCLGVEVEKRDFKQESTTCEHADSKHEMVNLAMCEMKSYEGNEVWLYSFLTSALDGGEWSASRSDRLIGS